MIGAGFRMVSAGTDVFALIKIGAIVFGVVGIAGLGYAGCTKLMNAGYSQAEADRLEDIAVRNAETAGKLQSDMKSARSAEERWRKQRDAAFVEVEKAKAEARRKTAKRKPGSVGVCPVGCTIPRGDR